MTVDPQSAAQTPVDSRRVGIRSLILPFALTACVCLAVFAGFWLGRTSAPGVPESLPKMLAASAVGSDTMAVATGPISSEAEGIFFLDFLTGDLQCLVYYPRAGSFGAHYYTNVLPRLGGRTRNSKYLMVTGQAVRNATTGGPQPAASLVYITDTTSGMFAAYAVPWDRTAESSYRAQSGELVYVGGGPVRNYQLPDPGQKQPAAIVDPNKKKP